VASSDRFVYFVDLGRWEIPSNTAVNATSQVSADPGLIATAAVTNGFTPTASWRATFEGELPRLASRPAQSGGGSAPWIALQAGAAPFSQVVTVEDPSVGIRLDDIVVVTDPSGLGTCASPFDATITGFLAADPDHPGGALAVGPTGDPCVAALGAGKTSLRATVRAGDWVLVRGTGASATVVDRPHLGDPENVVSGERISYVPELNDPVGPALAFTLRLDPDAATTSLSRGATARIETSEGRSPFRVQGGVDARDVVPFDRSQVPGREAGGVRFFVPYVNDAVLDVSPSASGGGAVTLR
jgi:hypothetical protein